MGELLTALKCWPQQLVSEEQYSQSVNVQCALLARFVSVDIELNVFVTKLQYDIKCSFRSLTDADIV